jgi:hypothetical protein
MFQLFQMPPMPNGSPDLSAMVNGRLILALDVAPLEVAVHWHDTAPTLVGITE